MSTRFVIRKNLGKGVFEAVDGDRGATVALKKLASSSASPDAQLRFKSEFRSLADVVHPNLAALYELFVDDGGLSFTMELVRGVHFIDAFRDRWLPRSKKLDFAKVRERLQQLAAGVSAIHAAGMLHRDLKHSNVLVEDGGGRVVILDFGLVSEVEAAVAPFEPPRQSVADDDGGDGGPVNVIRFNTASSQPGLIVKQPGTPPYMGPELFAGKAPTPASDWYSVGVMLYEVLTGSALFRGPLGDVVVEKRRPLPPVRSLAPDVPDDLATLCDGLVDRDPTKRPVPFTATTTAAATATATATTAAATTQDDAIGDLVGRERELLALDAAFAQRPSVALVHGPSGVGKSALIEAWLERSASKGALVVAGKCYERETVPFKAWDGVVDALSRHLATLSADERAAVAPKEAGALARLFPALGFERSSGDIDPVELRRRGFAALSELLAKLAARQPVVVVIDDMQWGDVDSALLLDDVLRPPAPPLFVLGAFRSDERESSPFLRRLLARARPKQTSVVDVAVKELAYDDAVRLARMKLGADGAGADAIALESGGHPFFIDELVRFAKSGAALRDGAKPDVARAILARVERLPDGARHLLEVVALASAPLDRRAAAPAARIVTDDDHALATLRSSHLVRVRTTETRQLLETYHDRIRETVVAKLSPDERRFLHRHLADALERLPDTDPEALAHHLHGASDDVRAARFAEQAAARALSTLAFFRAARLYEMALALGASATLHEKRARALVNAGQCAEAAKAFLAAAQSAAPAQARDLRRQAAEMLLLSGRTDEGLAIFRDVLAGLGMSLRPSSALTVASILAQQLRLRVLGTSFTAREAATLSDDELFRIDVCRSVSVGLATGGADAMTALDFQERYLLAALSAGEPRRVAHALAREAMGIATGAGLAGRPRVDGVLAQSEALTAQVAPDDPYLTAHRLLCRGVATFFFDGFAQAIEQIDVAERMLRDRCTGVWPEISQVHFYRLGALFALDRWRALDEDAARVFIEGEENGDAYTMANCELNLSRSWLMRDDPEQAVALVDDVADRWSTAGFQLVHWLVLYHRTNALLYAGRAADAYAGLSSSWRRVTRSQLLRVRLLHVYAHQLRAAAALSVGKLDEAAAMAARLDRHGTPWASARAALVQAGVSHARGDGAAASAHLRRAIALADGAGLPMHAALARMRLGGDDVDAGRAWMRDEGIVDPDRLADMLAPGFSGRRTG